MARLRSEVQMAQMHVLLQRLLCTIRRWQDISRRDTIHTCEIPLPF